ncbi:copper chaperone [Pontibacter silvestris]|uniref:Copper chaperone n=1 Tax=Pontibacter silvestris TaxID=2305183 RepID=A0ABW4X3D8_9BACT|nr:copper chaperone [Pontibacter silvestris]MCC9138794.1 copper chaperone [Pontibacter silvestris]
MEIIKFKTNVETQAGLSKVAPHLEKVANLSKWNLDTDSDDRVLSVSGEELDPQAVKNAVEAAGYKAEVIRVMGIGGGDL